MKITVEIRIEMTENEIEEPRRWAHGTQIWNKHRTTEVRIKKELGKEIIDKTMTIFTPAVTQKIHDKSQTRIRIRNGKTYPPLTIEAYPVTALITAKIKQKHKH